MTNLTETLAESLKERGVKLSFGEKVELGGVEVLPVALVSYGFGAGGDDTGSGGGAGGGSAPVGVYLNQGGEVRFRPNLIALLAVSIPVIWSTGWALSSIIRALKKH
jgi:uncharacterized spore protein YtfJ